MSAPRADLAAGLDAIWQRRRGSVLGRVAVLDRAAAAARAGWLSGDARSEACAEAHKLAGSAGSFGFPTASELALEAELALEPGAPLDAAAAQRLQDVAHALRSELSGTPVTLEEGT